MLHASHARYDDMGRVYVLAVCYQVCGCSKYNMQGITTWPGCMYYYYVHGQDVCITCDVSGTWVLHVRYDYIHRHGICIT